MVALHPWVLVSCVSVLLLALGATSGLVNSRLWMSEPLVCAIAGVLLGPLALDLVSIDVGHDPGARAFVREAARVTIAIAVLAGAIRLPRGWLRRNWTGLAVAIGPGMLLMWAAGAAVTLATLHLPLLTCALIGAIIAPTDPVLSAPVVSGALAARAVPADLRHAITAESSANDGLAQPIVMLPLLLIVAAQRGGGHSGGPFGGVGDVLAHWGLSAVAFDVGGAIVVGAAAGFAARACMRWASRDPDADHASLLTISLALALAVLGGLQAMGANGVLGAFVAGAVVNDEYGDDYREHQEHFNEAITRFFDLPIMFLLGAAAPWSAWLHLGWPGLLFALGILLLRRLPAWLLLHRLMPWTRPLPQALFAGWFGPVGAAALFYACDAQDLTGIGAIWPIVSLAAAASVVAHGISGTHLSRLLGRVGERRTAAARRAAEPAGTKS